MASPSILLIDDEPELLYALSVRLIAAGFSCDTAGNGKIGLERIEQHRPDIVVADLLMPVMDGFELVRRLKADVSTASIPVIVLTAVPARALEPRAQELRGVAQVMYKPFDSSELVTSVRQVLAQPSVGGSRDG